MLAAEPLEQVAAAVRGEPVANHANRGAVRPMRPVALAVAASAAPAAVRGGTGREHAPGQIVERSLPMRNACG
jgi:hypothetical protein